MTWPVRSRVVGEASGFERDHFLFVLLVQQDAFVSIPMLIKNLPNGEMRGVENIYNTVGVALSILLIGWICLQRLRPLASIGRTNLWAMLFTCLVLLSAIWSIHPSITIRRGVGYVLTIIVGALVPLRFGVTGFMKVLSASFAISALVHLYLSQCSRSTELCRSRVSRGVGKASLLPRNCSIGHGGGDLC